MKILFKDIRKMISNLKINSIKLTYNCIGEGNKTDNDSGLFIHTGGWLFVHE